MTDCLAWKMDHGQRDTLKGFQQPLSCRTSRLSLGVACIQTPQWHALCLQFFSRHMLYQRQYSQSQRKQANP